MRTDSRLSEKLAGLLPALDERARRLVAAAEAMAQPRGGVSLVHRCCGMSRATIIKGMRELHCNGIEGVWTGLRNFLRTFRGVSKKYLAQ